MSLDCLGANVEIGLEGWTQGLGNILQAAGGLATGITSTVEQAQAEKKLKADQEAALKAAIAADKAAAVAIAKASVSAKLAEDPAAVPAVKQRAALDQQAAAAARSRQSAAASGLSGDASAKRAATAETERLAAIDAARADSGNAVKVALVDAWGEIINKSNNATMVKKDQEASAPATSGESWFSQKTGPVPNWLGAGVAATAAGLLAKKFLFK